jgi:hypothetical protein
MILMLLPHSPSRTISSPSVKMRRVPWLESRPNHSEADIDGCQAWLEHRQESLRPVVTLAEAGVGETETAIL